VFAGAANDPAASVFPGLVDEAVRALVRAVRRLSSSSPPPEWHRVRVLAKRARYAAEAVAPVLGKSARRQGAALEQVTELLGDWHDCVVAGETLRELAGLPGIDGRTGYALGLLDAIEAGREADDKAAFPAVWREVRRVLHRHPLA
jgi:CHAD domain-containing protein